MKYGGLLEAIEALHQETAGKAVAAINRWLILRNWLIGAYLVEFEQNGEERAAYGEQLLERIAKDVKKHEIRGLGVSMLKTCRQFYRSFPQIRQSLPDDLAVPSIGAIRQSLIGESKETSTKSNAFRDAPAPLASDQLLRLSWTHLIELIRIDDPWKRAFYENESLLGNWSVRQLQRQIGSMLYERTGLSTNKRAVLERSRRQDHPWQSSIADLIRDPYVLEFAGLAEKPRYLESDLESALLDHLQSFLLELGNGFCFEARQRRITVGNEHDYIDLVFYHRRLRCHLIVDLKIRAFKHADAGQMNFYLNYWKSHEMEDDDNPPVGLLLCSDKDATRVEYAAAGIDHQLFVSRYLVALPQPEKLREMIEADRASLEAGASGKGRGVQ